MIEKKLESLEIRFRELESLLSDATVISNNENYMKFSREHSSLVLIMQKYTELKRINNDIKNLEELKNSTDQELKLIAASEYEEMQGKKKKLEIELKFMLLPADPNDGKNIIVEIRAGTGGERGRAICGRPFQDVQPLRREKGLESRAYGQPLDGPRRVQRSHIQRFR